MRQIFTFYKAQGKKTGASLVEDDKVELAKELMVRAAASCVNAAVQSASKCLSATRHATRASRASLAPHRIPARQ